MYIRTIAAISLLLILGITTKNLHAQISVSAMGVETLKDAPFKYKGSRVMMSDRVDDAFSKNIFLFTKPAKGALPDTLFVQKYTKTGEVWKTVLVKEIVHNGIISLVGNRKGFTDGNQDKEVDAFFIYNLLNADGTKQQSANLLLIHKNIIYTLSAAPDSKSGTYERTVYSPNFSTLNVKLKEEVIKYWEGLDKE